MPPSVWKKIYINVNFSKQFIFYNMTYDVLRFLLFLKSLKNLCMPFRSNYKNLQMPENISFHSHFDICNLFWKIWILTIVKKINFKNHFCEFSLYAIFKIVHPFQKRSFLKSISRFSQFLQPLKIRIYVSDQNRKKLKIPHQIYIHAHFEIYILFWKIRILTL